MSTINDVYAALQHSSCPLTLNNLTDAVEDNTGVRPHRDQICHAAAQLTQEGFAVRVRRGVYRAARQGSSTPALGVIDGATTTTVLVSAQQPPSGEACNLSHAEILQLLFGPRFEATSDQVPHVREPTHAIDGINSSLRNGNASR